MSLYYVQKLLYHINREPEVRAQFEPARVPHGITA